MKIKLIWIFVISFLGMSIYSPVYSQTNSSTVTPVGQNKKPSFISVDSNTMTYTNSEYGFQFQYPNSMGSTIVEVPQNQNDDCLHEVLTTKVISDNFDPDIKIQIFRNEKGNSDTPGLKNKIMKFHGVSSWPEVLNIFPCGVSKMSVLNVGGYQAMKINYNECVEYSRAGVPAAWVYVFSSKYIFRILFGGNLKKVDQILGTFKISNN